MTSSHILALTVAIATTHWLAQAAQPTLTTIYNFTYGLDGGYPYGDLLVRQTGALYGMAGGGPPDCGGEPDCGIIFELTPPGAPGGAWTETILYAFQGRPDGMNPSSGVTIGSNGVLAGTTHFGGQAPVKGSLAI